MSKECYVWRNILDMKKIGLALLVAFGGFAQAQTIVSDRPTQAVSSTVIPVGTLQAETGMSVAFTPNGEKAGTKILAPTSLFRYGLSEYFEIRLLTQFESRKAPLDANRTSGMGDLQIGTKIRLLDKADDPTTVAFHTQIGIPTGSRGITNDIYRGYNNLSISHVLTDNVNFGYNVGFNYYASKNGDLTYAFVLDVAVNDKVSFFVEPYGQYARLLTFEASFDAGLTYLIKDNLKLDFSYGSGLNHKMNFMSVGFSWSTAKGTKKAPAAQPAN
jgi:hypothetical protein